jgi:hypothetical protein
LIILYYVTINGGVQFGLDLDYCEAIAYFLLHALINGTIIGDVFLTDQNSSALFNICQQSSKILQFYDSKLDQTIKNFNIDFILFAIPWIKILFALIYPIQLSLQLWDLLFAQIDKFQLNITLLIVAHIVSIRDRLIERDFNSVMFQLSHFEVQSQSQFTNICKHFRLIQRLEDV